MRRFDALQTRRAGTMAILRELPLDPASLVGLLPRLARSFVWMLETAGVSTTGLPGALRVKALGIVYLYALRIWIDDDTPDMARTMAALDKALRCADGWLTGFPLGFTSAQAPIYLRIEAEPPSPPWPERFVASAPPRTTFLQNAATYPGLLR